MQENTELNLSTFDDEAIEIAKELNDLKSIKYYQKIVNKIKKGEVNKEDFRIALEHTRNIIRTDQIDKTTFLRNPGGWFASMLNKLVEKRKKREQQALMRNHLEELKNKFLNKAKL